MKREKEITKEYSEKNKKIDARDRLLLKPKEIIPARATFRLRMLPVLVMSGFSISEARGRAIATVSAGNGRRPQPRFWSKRLRF